MEVNFNRFLQVSRAVEEKLAHVTSSDDLLQGIQLQMRKLEEALTTTEEKYQRLERKSQVLDNTNDSVDRNFKVLQESEKLSAKIGGDLDRYAEDINSIKTAIEKLADESDKAREAVDRIDVLDKLLEEIEERIKSMQRTRQWIADAETRLEELNKDAQIQARTIDAIVKGRNTGPIPDSGGTLSSQQMKENIIALIRRGWKEDEIAKSLKISIAQVQLTREMAPKD
jgi:methyl-accepting chemotaxis protein